MQLIINGESMELATDLTLAGLVQELNIEGKIAIELNEDIVPRSLYEKTSLKSGDCIEIVNAIGGG